MMDSRIRRWATVQQSFIQQSAPRKPFWSKFFAHRSYFAQRAQLGTQDAPTQQIPQRSDLVSPSLQFHSQR